MRKIAGAGEAGGDGADGLVGGLDAGAVSEDDDAGGHGYGLNLLYVGGVSSVWREKPRSEAERVEVALDCLVWRGLPRSAVSPGRSHWLPVGIELARAGRAGRGERGGASGSPEAPVNPISGPQP